MATKGSRTNHDQRGQPQLTKWKAKPTEIKEQNKSNSPSTHLQATKNIIFFKEAPKK
jgi:hypothetical protein